MAFCDPPDLSPEELCCPICFEDFDNYDAQRNPKLLLCLHTYCNGCCESLLKYDGSLQCSICRQLHRDVRISELMDNYVICNYLRKLQEDSDAMFAKEEAARFKKEEEEYLKRQKFEEEETIRIVMHQQALYEEEVRQREQQRLEIEKDAQLALSEHERLVLEEEGESTTPKIQARNREQYEAILDDTLEYETSTEAVLHSCSETHISQAKEQKRRDEFQAMLDEIQSIPCTQPNRQLSVAVNSTACSSSSSDNQDDADSESDEDYSTSGNGNSHPNHENSYIPLSSDEESEDYIEISDSSNYQDDDDDENEENEVSVHSNEGIIDHLTDGVIVISETDDDSQDIFSSVEEDAIDDQVVFDLSSEEYSGVSTTNHNSSDKIKVSPSMESRIVDPNETTNSDLDILSDSNGNDDSDLASPNMYLNHHNKQSKTTPLSVGGGNSCPTDELDDMWYPLDCEAADNDPNDNPFFDDCEVSESSMCFEDAFA